MKPITRWILRIVAAVVLIGIGFCIGSVYAGRTATFGSHLSAISYFTAIDAALDRQDAQKARSLADSAIDLDISALRALEDWPTSAWIYGAPWMSACYESSMSKYFRQNTEAF